MARRRLAFALALAQLLGLTSCRRESESAKEATITVYGFSVVKEPLEVDLMPAFAQD